MARLRLDRIHFVVVDLLAQHLIEEELEIELVPQIVQQRDDAAHIPVDDFCVEITETANR